MYIKYEFSGLYTQNGLDNLKSNMTIIQYGKNIE